MYLSKEFEKYHKRILGNDYGKLVSYFSEPQVRHSIRVNTLKTGLRSVKRLLSESNIGYGAVPWCPHGLWVDSCDLDSLWHQLGYYYVQNASSMIAPQVLGPGKRVLDLCAAPGGKTTHLAQLMGNSGTLIANEDNPSRIKALVYNVQRCGLINAKVTMLDGCRRHGWGQAFDRILVDAPCSSVGTLRQNRDIMGKWSMRWVEGLAGIQKMMLLAAYDSLAPGGRMAYSTCTTTLEENEGNIEFLLDERCGARLLRVELRGLTVRPGLTDKTFNCARVYPMDNQSDPHFIALVEKK
jgi:tRNA (cytosine49-C5)-methyltransferase